MSGYSDYIVPLIILAVTVVGIIKKTDIFRQARYYFQRAAVPGMACLTEHILNYTW